MKFILLIIALYFYSSSCSNLRDRKICATCLNILDELKVAKSSQICESQKYQGEIMCYEVYYYFYYFNPDFFYSVDKFDMSKSCKVCSNLDKCNYNECTNTIEKPIKFLNFLAIIEKKQNSPAENFVNEHLDIIKLKLEHSMEELYNLGNIHNSAIEIKKSFRNMLIFNKLQMNNKTIVPNQIKKVSKSENGFINHLDELSGKLLSVFKTESSDYNLFLQIFNHVNKLGMMMFETNNKIISSIMSSILSHHIRNVTHVENISSQKEIQFLLEKLKKLEEEHDKYKMYINSTILTKHNNEINKHIESISKNKINSDFKVTTNSKTNNTKQNTTRNLINIKSSLLKENNSTSLHIQNKTILPNLIFNKNITILNRTKIRTTNMTNTSTDMKKTPIPTQIKKTPIPIQIKKTPIPNQMKTNKTIYEPINLPPEPTIEQYPKLNAKYTKQYHKRHRSKRIRFRKLIDIPEIS